MDFYNLQESDHRLIERSMGLASTATPSYKEYVGRDVFNFDRVLNKKNILLAEEDPQIQQALQKLIQDANAEAQCWFVDSVDEITDLLDERKCDLLIANYYLSEDEIDYEFWEQIRGQFPGMDVIILSHVNDREFYELLEKISRADHEVRRHRPFSERIKNFFEYVFGG